MNTSSSWTPLWSTIVTSTLWSEPKDARILFITMLALKDVDGIVRAASVEGLARLANLTADECRSALTLLESPDTRTETHQEFDGRRVERVEGGWRVLNHVKYREMIRSIKRKTYQSAWQADYRAGKAAAKAGKPSGQTIRDIVRKSVEADPQTKQDKAELRRMRRNGKRQPETAGQADAAPDDRGVS